MNLVSHSHLYGLIKEICFPILLIYCKKKVGLHECIYEALIPLALLSCRRWLRPLTLCRQISMYQNRPPIIDTSFYFLNFTALLQNFPTALFLLNIPQLSTPTFFRSQFTACLLNMARSSPKLVLAVLLKVHGSGTRSLSTSICFHLSTHLISGPAEGIPAASHSPLPLLF